jgi:CARDB
MPGSAWKPILAVVSALAVAGSGVGIGLAMSSPSEELAMSSPSAESALPTTVTTTQASARPTTVTTRQASARPTTVTTRQASECPSPPPNKGYYYVVVLECGADFKEAAATLTLPQKLPKVDPGGHSIGEITIVQSIQPESSTCAVNGIEAGWIVGVGGPRPSWIPDWVPRGFPLFGGGDSDRIRFFVFKTNARQEDPATSGYAPDLDWVSLGVSPQPDDVIPAGEPLKLRIHYDPDPSNDGGRWYVSVNDKDVGYYRGNSWSDPCGGFKPNRIQWYGEVSDPNTPCAEMGNGYPGSDSHAVGFTQLRSAPSTEHPRRRMVVTDPSLYSSDRATRGKNYEEFDGDAFRYGGSGKCEGQQTSEEKKLSGNQESSKDPTPTAKQPVTRPASPPTQPDTDSPPVCTAGDRDNDGVCDDVDTCTGGGADLEPTAITYEVPVVQAGQRVYFDSGVENQGAVDSGVFAIKWLVDGQEVGAYGSHDGVPAKSTVMDGNSQFTWTFDSPGTYKLTFAVDADDHVQCEANESDNVRYKTVQVEQAVKEEPEEAAPTTEETPTTEPRETPTSAPTETTTAPTPEPSEAAKATTAPGTTPSSPVPFYTLAPTP